jgi:hypothetical protein
LDWQDEPEAVRFSRRPKRQEYRDHHSQRADAMYPYLAHRSVLLIGRKEGKPHRIGAGTLVQVGDALLVATAAHVLKDLQVGDVWVLPYQRTQRDRVPVRSMGGNIDADVAWVELDLGGMPSAWVWPRAEVGDLRGRQTEVDDVVAVFGYPGELLRRPTSADATYGIVPMCLVGGTVGVAEWPAHTEGLPLQRGVDLLVDYLPSGQIEGDPLARAVPSPAGMSGGGVWNIRTQHAGIWAPDRANLIGIQTAWYPRRRLLRAAQIQHWVACVERDRPDLVPGLAGFSRGPK